ncbi:cytidine deaminase-like [Apostichopus japonicus]|uniref:cytidine deaminase-like n=1 Tax=Stichopus japonicus TaxID=307972 RepID=UPI003AB78306
MEDSNISDKIREMMAKSVEAKSHAYSPYSHFRVGAALLTDDGQIIEGCNVENASYSLGVCAERCAIFKAVSDGHSNFKAIAVNSDIKDEFTSPCGACRQVIYEFGKDIDVYLVKPDMTYKMVPIKTLLPLGFHGECLNMKKILTD